MDAFRLVAVFWRVVSAVFSSSSAMVLSVVGLLCFVWMLLQPILGLADVCLQQAGTRGEEPEIAFVHRLSTQPNAVGADRRDGLSASALCCWQWCRCGLGGMTALVALASPWQWLLAARR